MKGYNGSSILCAILLCAVFVSPAFADMDKVNDDELARTNASVTGTPLKHLNCVEKDGVCEGMKQDYVTSDKGVSFSSPLQSKVTETWTYNYGTIDPNHFGVLNVIPSR